MPLAQWLLLKVPTILLGTIIVAVTVTFAVGGLIIVRRFVKIENLKNHHDIAGPIFNTLGVVYAVLMAFVVVISWQNYDKANSDAVKEANCYADLYRDATGLSEPFRSQAKDAMNKYLSAVVNEEWKMMAWGERSLQVQALASKVWDLYAAYQPQTETEKIFFAESIRKMNEAGELRRERLVNAKTGIHPILWFILLLGGVITITFTFFFGSSNFTAQIIMTTLLSVTIALILFTILSLDYPFTGDISIKSDVFEETLKYLMN